jgi:PAP2 superfamily protein
LLSCCRTPRREPLQLTPMAPKPNLPYNHDRWPEHPAVLAVAAWYVAGACLVSVWLRAPGMTAALNSTLFYQLSALLAVPYIVGRAIQRRLALRARDGAPVRAVDAWRTVWSQLRAAELSPPRLRDVALLTLVLGLFLNAFSCWKHEMGTIRPFSADAILSRVDILLHGGKPPWEILQPLLGHPAITRLIDWGYEGVWFTCVTVAVLAMAWQRPSVERTRFFLAFVLTWSLLGTGLAYLFPSAGPAYYHLVVGGVDPYAGLRSYLETVGRHYDLATLHIQPALWLVEHRGVSTVGSGIAAMPSLHVALPALLVCSTWTTRRWLAGMLAVYTAFVIVSSIHLGWHYAVDGYVAVMLVVAIWEVAGLITARWTRARVSPQVFSPAAHAAGILVTRR